MDPGSHSNEKHDPDPHSNDGLDPDPHQSDPDPHQSDPDPQSWLKYFTVELAVIRVMLIAGRIQEAALMQASVENWAECLAALHLGQYRGLAALLLHHVGTKGT